MTWVRRFIPPLLDFLVCLFYFPSSLWDLLRWKVVESQQGEIHLGPALNPMDGLVASLCQTIISRLAPFPPESLSQDRGYVDVV
jgi:hypothetical protein